MLPIVLRVDAAFPVQVKDMLGRLVGVLHYDLLEHRAQDAPVALKKRVLALRTPSEPLSQREKERLLELGGDLRLLG